MHRYEAVGVTVQRIRTGATMREQQLHYLRLTSVARAVQGRLRAASTTGQATTGLLYVSHTIAEHRSAENLICSLGV